MLSRRRFLALGAAGAGAAVAGGAVAASFSAAMREAEARLENASEVVQTRFGTLEYAVAGEGAPLLMVHGSGGGFDQGLAFAQRLVAAGHTVIAPSRFGYLRSDLPPDPSSANQADAFVGLLDALGIDRLPVIGGSAGALSAIEFAIRHPGRCSALVAVVPATYAPERPSAQPMSAMQEAVMKAMLGSDFLFWAALHLMRGQMVGTMLATDPALLDAAAPEERARVETILRGILPVSRRSRGLLNDMRLASDPAPAAVETIRLPTLAVSVEDDRFGTADAARYLASQVEGARLVVYPSGGHIWLGHDVALFAEIAAFLAQLGPAGAG